MQEKFTDLPAAKARVQQLMDDDDQEINSLYLIHDLRAGMFYVEGDIGDDDQTCGLIRPGFETLLWSLS